jgi:hypothetical protein
MSASSSRKILACGVMVAWTAIAVAPAQSAETSVHYRKELAKTCAPSFNNCGVEFPKVLAHHRIEVEHISCRVKITSTLLDLYATTGPAFAVHEYLEPGWTRQVDGYTQISFSADPGIFVPAGEQLIIGVSTLEPTISLTCSVFGRMVTIT